MTADAAQRGTGRALDLTLGRMTNVTTMPVGAGRSRGVPEPPEPGQKLVVDCCGNPYWVAIGFHPATNFCLAELAALSDC